MSRLLLLLPLFACTSSGDPADTEKPAKDDSAADTSADTDTDADTDADTDTDTDTDTNSGTPDLSTYTGFVDAHAGAWCASLEACGYLDDKGYADVRACVEATVAFLSAEACRDYQENVANICLREDLRMARACEEFPGGVAARACQEVCTPPAE